MSLATGSSASPTNTLPPRHHRLRLDEADPQHILVCGDRRLARAVTEIETAVTTGLRDAVRLARELKDTPKENASALRRRKNALDDKNEDNVALQTLFAEVTATGKIPTAAGSVLSTGLSRSLSELTSATTQPLRRISGSNS